MFDLGEATTETIATDYYQYNTGPVKVMSAPQAGTVGYDLVTKVEANDFIIQRENKDKLNAISKDRRDFQAKLSDKQGKILSDSVYKPGEVITFLSPDFGGGLSTACSRKM